MVICIVGIYDWDNQNIKQDFDSKYNLEILVIKKTVLLLCSHTSCLQLYHI
jgi:hypothetical protein